MSETPVEYGKKKERLLVEIGLVIDHLYKNPSSKMPYADEYDLCVSPLTYFYAYKNTDCPETAAKLKKILSSLEILSIDQQIAKAANDYAEDYRLNNFEAFDIALAMNLGITYCTLPNLHNTRVMGLKILDTKLLGTI